MVVLSRPRDRLTAAATAPPVSRPAPHSALLPIGYPMGRFGTVRLALTDVVYEEIESDLRSSHRPSCRDAAVRAFVEFLALRASHSPPCHDTAVLPLVKFLTLRASLGWPHSPQPHTFVFHRNEYLAGRAVALGCGGDRNEICRNNHCDEYEASAKTQAKRRCFLTHDAPPHLMSLARLNPSPAAVTSAIA
jgi:hypothetical protein